MEEFRKSALELGRRLLGGIGAALVTVALVWGGFLEPLETWSLAQLFEFRGARAPVAPIVIVTIDESSFAELNTQWPFPRAMHGELLDRISAGGPLAIGLDLIFDTPAHPFLHGPGARRAGLPVQAAVEGAEALRLAPGR